jgi:hypothetical protein
MKKNLQKIDHIFFRALNKHNEEPEENVWSAIENDLNRIDAEKYKARYTSLRKAFVLTIVTASCLVITEVSRFTIYDHAKNDMGNKVTPNKNVFANNGNSKKDARSTDQKINLVVFNKATETLTGHAATGASTNDEALTQSDIPEIVFSENEPVEIIRKLSQSTFQTPALLEKTVSFSERSDETTTRNETKAKTKHSFYIIPYGSFDHVINKSEEEYEFNHEDASEVEKREKSGISYTAGLLFEYSLSKKISLQSGLSISNSFTSISPTIIKAFRDNSGQYKFKLATTYGLAEIKKTGIPQSGDSILLNSASMHLQYFSIPMLMKINLKPGKFTFSAATGLAVNRIIGDKAQVNFATATAHETETVEKIEGLKNTFFTIVAGAEASYSINKRIAVGISPGIRYAITSVNKGTPVKTYPVTVGVGAGLHINL